MWDAAALQLGILQGIATRTAIEHPHMLQNIRVVDLVNAMGLQNQTPDHTGEDNFPLPHNNHTIETDRVDPQHRIHKLKLHHLQSWHILGI